MPRYFFDVANGHRLFDSLGFVCEDDFAALIRGSVLAIGISLDKPEDDPERHVAIINDQGREIGTVPVYSTPSYKNPAASVVGLWYPSPATALLARWRIDCAARLHRLNDR